MAKKKVEESIKELVLPIVETQSFELVDIEFLKEGAYWYLRVYIDKPGGITIDDCAIVSQILSDKLDENDFIEQRYFLEVSSPGLERPLKKDCDFEKFKGEFVEVKLFQPHEGKKIFEGKLLGLLNDKIAIQLEKGEPLEFERDKVSKVRRVIKF